MSQADSNGAIHSVNGNGTQASKAIHPEKKTGLDVVVKDKPEADPWITLQIGRIFVAISELEIGLYHREVLFQIARLSMKYGFCWPAKTTLAEYLGIERSVVSRIIASLAATGLIAIGT